jgi:iron(III) transport system permease protein
MLGDPTPPDSERHHRLRRSSPPAAVVIPAVLVALAVLVPLAYLLIRAGDASGGVFDYLLRPRTLGVLGRTLLLVAGVTLGSLLLALPLAYLTTRTDLPGRRLWAVLTTLPLVIPSYVFAFAFISAFATGGLLATGLGLRLPVSGFWGALLVITGIKAFYYITLPLLRPALAAGGLLVALYVLSDFGAVSLLRYTTFTRAIYVQYENSFNRGNAAALGLMLVLLTLLILLADSQLRGRGRVRRAGVGEARRRSRRSLGRWRWPALAFVSLVVALALLAPLAIIVGWLLRGIASGQVSAFDWSTVVNAAGVALVAALLSLAAAIPVAVLAVRFPSRLSALLERFSYLGYALPGIVVALALVFFGARYVPWIYQTHAMLVFAYLLLFLPQAVGNLRAALLQIDPHLEEAARSLGRKPVGAIFSVTLPLLRSGLVTSAMLVFLTTMKELPATLLLRPTGFDTLATALWSWTTEAFFAQAAPYALALVVVSGVSVGVLLMQEGEG